jgi:AcrR family transcriptional regulator
VFKKGFLPMPSSDAPGTVPQTTGPQTTGPRAQRADARRNVAAILDAATDCLARDPEVSTADIAAAAGVGRITLYGHFKNRAELVDAVMGRAIEHADAILAAIDTAGDPREELARLVAASWQIVHRFRNILLAAHRELPSERIRGIHDPVLRQVQDLIERGQRTGAFRSDMPMHWLTTTSFSLMHAAAEDVAAGRLDASDAPRLITATLLGAFTPPAADSPGVTALNGQ